jgi:hypothetical protein
MKHMFKTFYGWVYDCVYYGAKGISEVGGKAVEAASELIGGNDDE